MQSKKIFVLWPVGAKEGMVSEEISTIKKPTSLHWDSRKDALRPYQKLARPC
jgi:hypothetical protein